MQGRRWLVDCGADYCMTPHRNQLMQMEASPLTHVMAAGGEQLPVLGQGRCVILLGDGKYLELPRVQLVPGLPCPLLSVSRLNDLGLAPHLTTERHYMGDAKGKVVLATEQKTGALNEGVLYYLPYPTLADPEVSDHTLPKGTEAGTHGEYWYT